jgi:hypothetical protein
VTAGPGCTITGQDVVCRIAALGPGEQHAFQVAARAEKSAAGRTLTNRGTVTAVAADPRAANDVGQAQVQIRPLPPPVVVTTQCKSRRHFTIRLKERRGREIRWARVFVRGHPVAVMRRRSDHRLVADIDLRGLPKGVYHVVIKARLRDGRRARWVRSYHTCVGPLPPSNHLDDPRAL